MGPERWPARSSGVSPRETRVRKQTSERSYTPQDARCACSRKMCCWELEGVPGWPDRRGGWYCRWRDGKENSRNGLDPGQALARNDASASLEAGEAALVTG